MDKDALADAVTERIFEPLLERRRGTPNNEYA
jgi:hypothetical protein